jgi:opacity protein-like surface antigen
MLPNNDNHPILNEPSEGMFKCVEFKEKHVPTIDVQQVQGRPISAFSRRIVSHAIAGLMLAAVVIPSGAQSEELSGSVTVYGWLPWLDTEVTAHSGAGDFKTSDDPGDFLDAIKAAFFVAGEVHYGRIGLLHDTVYADLGKSGTTSGPLASSVDVDVEVLIHTTALGYQVYREDGKLIEPFAGARYVDLEADVTVTGGGPAQISVSADAELDWWDPVIGVRGRLPLTERLTAGGFVDIGGFGAGSEFTWEVFAGLEYAVSDRFGLNAGFRYISIDYEAKRADLKLEIYGPVLGMTLRF